LGRVEQPFSALVAGRGDRLLPSSTGSFATNGLHCRSLLGEDRQRQRGPSPRGTPLRTASHHLLPRLGDWPQNFAIAE